MQVSDFEKQKNYDKPHLYETHIIWNSYFEKTLILHVSWEAEADAENLDFRYLARWRGQRKAHIKGREGEKRPSLEEKVTTLIRFSSQEKKIYKFLILGMLRGQRKAHFKGREEEKRPNLEENISTIKMFFHIFFSSEENI